MDKSQQLSIEIKSCLKSGFFPGIFGVVIGGSLKFEQSEKDLKRILGFLKTQRKLVESLK